MLIRQLSVFLENKQGRFTQVAQLLGQEGVNMTAFSVSENADFGILRLIVDETDRALDILRCHKYAVTEVDVFQLFAPLRAYAGLDRDLAVIGFDCFWADGFLVAG